MTQPDATLQARIAALLDFTPRRYRRLTGGYTPAARWLALGDGDSCFVKAATTPLTTRLLLIEIENYRRLSGPFMPRLIGWDADPVQPLLIIEDLSAAFWPPPWNAERVEQVCLAFEQMRQSTIRLDPFSTVHSRPGDSWQRVAADPQPFLRLGMVSDRWLQGALPLLIAAERACPLDGDALCHMDMRSDNLCLTASGVKIIDWPEACSGNPRLDLGFWLPSLEAEGGPPPETILLDAPNIAAWVAGFLAARAGLPQIPDAPKVRHVQQQQLSTALPWVCRALGLPPLAAPR